MTTWVIETGTANLASVMAALARAGAEPRLTRDANVVRDAERVVLPGVGAFGAAMASLSALAEPLKARISAGRPTLAICLGLQLFARESEESPGVAGLGVVDGRVVRFRGERGVRVPELGWNAVAAPPGGALEPGFAYYAHSYFLERAPAGWVSAFTTHGEKFVAAIERGRVLACQFHPELSGAWGAKLIARWLAGDRAGSGSDVASCARAAPRVIPCLDVKDGRVVKGVRFAGLRDAGDPTLLSLAYEAQGADELVLLDVSATPEGRQSAAGTVAAVRKGLSIPLTVGGGVKSAEDAARLLDAGADKVGVNTAAIERPALIDEIATRFGRQCAVLALDAAATGAGWEVVTHSGKKRTGIDAIAWAREAASRGAGEILLTSWDRDGTRGGYDLDLVRSISDAVPVPVIASGGAAHAEHLAEALFAGADAVLAASIFHDGETTVRDVKASLRARGVEVRPC